MNKILLLFFLLSLSYSANAQEKVPLKKNNLSILAGYNGSYFKDLNYSPLNYTANGIAIALGYKRQSQNNNLWYINFDLSYASLASNASDFFSADRYLSNLEIGYLKNIHEKNDKVNFALGGQYHSYVDIVSYNDFDALTFFATHGIDITTYFAYQLNTKSILTSRLSISIVAILVRPPYTGWNKEISDNEDQPVKILTDGNLASLNKFQSFSWENEYRHYLSDKLDLVVQYRLIYHRTKELDLSKNLNNQLLLGCSFKF